LKKSILVAILFLSGFGALHAQTRQTREEYIDRYKHIAVAHMERYGIPASITLAQGILESDCGNSALSRSSNNHFGIKCKNDWTGRRVFHDDDARGECFRAYGSVEASYEDHARFLDSPAALRLALRLPRRRLPQLGARIEGGRLRHRARLCAAAVPQHPRRRSSTCSTARRAKRSTQRATARAPSRPWKASKPEAA